METGTIGRVLAEATIENLRDLWAARSGLIHDDEIRRVAVDDALVDAGATTLTLPTRLIQQLGLVKSYEKQSRLSRGIGPVNIYEAVRLHLLDRFCAVDVMEVPDNVPVLIGQIPLVMLDLVVDLQGRLTGNPAHGGGHVLELY